MWEYVTSAAIARDSLSLLHQPIGLHGHTHVPVAFVENDGEVEGLGPRDGGSIALEGRRALVNPGSVGQPRDGDPRASYMVLDPAAGAISWHRVAYDIEAVQSAMRAVGLPAFLVSRLSIGL
jgi:diadenosine tetraphosphatase ApaH/serine/threonine PP2A family protein phosphatase